MGIEQPKWNILVYIKPINDICNYLWCMQCLVCKNNNYKNRMNKNLIISSSYAKLIMGRTDIILKKRTSHSWLSVSKWSIIHSLVGPSKLIWDFHQGPCMPLVFFSFRLEPHKWCFNSHNLHLQVHHRVPLFSEFPNLHLLNYKCEV